jgi:murein DD-endopeptidase MepM/ murein hydrolase activator NlpD
MRSLFYMVVILFGSVGIAHAATMRVMTPSVRQGQTIVAVFDAPTQATFDGIPVAAFPYQTGWRIIIPLSLSTKVGTHLLAATVDDQTVTKKITVTATKAPVINLPVPPKLNQTPQQLVQSLATTNNGIRDSVKAVTQTTYFTQSFGLPLYDNRTISSPFGEVRKTGDETITHLGTDFGARTGTRVATINAGTVADAYVDPVYGNSVIVNHGRGVYSLYLHLDTMKVAKGMPVKKGTIIGTVGETGLASAPHLHLSIKINGQSIDPLQFVSAFK